MALINLLPSISELANVASIVGLVVSVIGLAISIWVLVNTLKLKSAFRLSLGVPRLVEKLSDSASTLKKLSRKFDSSSRLINAELSKIEANVESVKEKDKKTEMAVQAFQVTIRVYRERPDESPDSGRSTASCKA